MVLLSVAIVIALLITIGLPVGAGFWLNKKWGVPWRIVSYGAMAFFIVQSVVTLILFGFNALVQNGILTMTEQAFARWQVGLSLLLAAVIGVAVRWAGMKYLKTENLSEQKPAFAVGIGYGGAESIILVGLPLLTTFYTMLTNINIDPATTTLDPAVAMHVQQLWQVPVSIPLAGSVERLSALVMHLTVTIVLVQVFLRKNKLFFAAAVGVELLVNGLVIGLSQAGLDFGWVILISVVLMAGNIYLLYWLKAFQVKKEEVVVVIQS